MKTTTFYYIRILFVILAITWLTSLFFLRSTGFAKESFHNTRVEEEFEDGSIIIWSGVSSISNKRHEYTILRGDGLSPSELETLSKVREGKVIIQAKKRFIAYVVCGTLFFITLIPLLFSVTFYSDDHAELNNHRISVYKNILLFFGYSDQEVKEIILYLKEHVSLTESSYRCHQEKGTYYRLIQLTREFLSTKQN